MAGRARKGPFMGAEANRQGDILGRNLDVERLRSARTLASVFMRLCVLVAVPYASPSMSPHACYRRWISLCVPPSDDYPHNAGDPQEYAGAACAINHATAGSGKWTPLLRWATVLKRVRDFFQKSD